IPGSNEEAGTDSGKKKCATRKGSRTFSIGDTSLFIGAQQRSDHFPVVLNNCPQTSLSCPTSLLQANAVELFCKDNAKSKLVSKLSKVAQD
ncbi:MAG TPA: hypothetical protein PLG66_18705, partial [Calditrichia bacterium]|nr:hypothetical protein [Calditrichia bacterium]